MDLGPIALWILPVALILWLTYRYLTATENVWKKAGIKCVPSWEVYRVLILLFRHPLHELVLRGYRTHGKLYGQYFMGSPTLSVGDPDLIRHVLVKDFQFFIDRVNLKTNDNIVDSMISLVQGEKWKRIRNIMSPSFTTGKIKKMTGIILDSADTLLKNMERQAIQGTPVNIKRMFGAFTMDAIATTAFGTKIDSHNDPDNPFILAAREVMSTRRQFWSLFAFMLSRILKYIGIKPSPMLSSKFFQDAALKIAEERQRTGQVRNDFLQLLMDATEKYKRNTKSSGNDTNDVIHENDDLEDECLEPEEGRGNEEKQSKQYKALTEDEFVAQCVLFFIAGYETVASTLSFAAYNLALNEECQEKLIAEIDEVLRQTKGQLTYEAVQDMKYMDNVISETLRLYPPAVSLQRVCTTECTLGDTNIRIPKGATVGIPIYALHHDPEYFPDPEKFDPDRFTPEAKASRNPYVYLPFGAGPRNCVGMRFALVEVKLCLANTLLHFRFRRCAGTKVPLEFHNGQPQIQPKEILLRIEKRADVTTED